MFLGEFEVFVRNYTEHLTNSTLLSHSTNYSTYQEVLLSTVDTPVDTPVDALCRMSSFADFWKIFVDFWIFLDYD